MSECKALMVNRGEDKSVSHQIETIQIDDLPADGDVLVAVEYSTVNYKDGLCLGGKGGLVRTIRIFRALILLAKWSIAKTRAMPW